MEQKRSFFSWSYMLLCMITSISFKIEILQAENSISFQASTNVVPAPPQGMFFNSSGECLVPLIQDNTFLFDDEVCSIGNYAFHNCNRLIKLGLPESVEKIGHFAFSNCEQLKEPVFNSKLFARLPTNHEGKYQIPNGINTIASTAFRNCTRLTDVDIPTSVSQIEENAFSNCTSLTSIHIPANVQKISDYAFYGCTKLRRIYFDANDNVEVLLSGISKNAFAGLKDCILFVPEGTVEMYQQAFNMPVAAIVEAGSQAKVATFDGDFSSEVLFNTLTEAITETNALVIELKKNISLPSNARINTPQKNTLIKTHSDLGLANIENVVVNNVCNKLVITDNEAFCNNEVFRASNVSYHRKSSNTWGTICLPFAVTSNENVQYYTSGSICNDVLELEPTETVNAGEPAIFKRMNKDGLEIICNNAQITLEENESTTNSGIFLHGTFVHQERTEEGLYYIANNKFWLKTEGKPLTINAFRAWFSTSNSNHAPALSISEEETASIKALNALLENSATIFDMNGNAITQLQPGMNLVKSQDGSVKKILIKE